MPFNVDTTSPGDDTNAMGVWARQVYGDLLEIAGVLNPTEANATLALAKLAYKFGNLWEENPASTNTAILTPTDPIVFDGLKCRNSWSVGVTPHAYSQGGVDYYKGFIIAEAGWYIVSAGLGMTGGAGNIYLQQRVEINGVVQFESRRKSSDNTYNRLFNSAVLYLNVADELNHLYALNTDQPQNEARMTNSPETVLRVVRIPNYL